jgi:hypothetical protein
MAPQYKLCFPRIEEDIRSRKRTLFHWPCADEETRHLEFSSDDIMWITATKNGPPVAIVAFTQTTKDHLSKIVADDLPLLNLPPEALADYRKRWDEANPAFPFDSDPLVWRVVFRYLTL